MPVVPPVGAKGIVDDRGPAGIVPKAKEREAAAKDVVPCPQGKDQSRRSGIPGDSKNAGEGFFVEFSTLHGGADREMGALVTTAGGGMRAVRQSRGGGRNALPRLGRFSR